MTFADLLEAVRLEAIRRVRAGDFSERSLARRSGLSQAHLHNVLKQARVMTPNVADSLLVALRVSVLDLAPEAPRKPPGSAPVDPRYRGRAASE